VTVIPENLEEQSVPDLKTTAKSLGVEGFSKMKKPELVEAIRQTTLPQAPVDEAGTPIGDVPPDDVYGRLDLLEQRVSTLESRVTGVDERTRPSSQILGSNAGG
jgi:hypothetical protein